ncbi:MAG TPA: hypothetical protein VNZ52_12380, partial [Candidatus Thermoplasmatota archaeon]|nr:hypothetical protein [Candidatus Thermoplasmatota archaeon]
PLNLVKVRLLPGQDAALDAFLASPEAAAGDAKAVKEALTQAHWSGPVAYLPLETTGTADPARTVREVAGPFLEVVSVTPIEQVTGVEEEEEEEAPRRRGDGGSRPKKASAPRKSAASEED